VIVEFMVEGVAETLQETTLDALPSAIRDSIPRSLGSLRVERFHTGLGARPADTGIGHDRWRGNRFDTWAVDMRRNGDGTWRCDAEHCRGSMTKAGWGTFHPHKPVRLG